MISRRGFIKTSLAGTAVFALPHILSAQDTNKPNILWITSEDNSPLLGCYGDEFATTPNLDKLAAEGVLYENAFANAPVCAPARCTIITGMYACSMGTHHMRSRYKKPDIVKPYPSYLKEAGYYCTNNGKTDFNFEGNDKEYWDLCSRKTAGKDRKNNQPFFSIINLGTSHESSIHKSQAATRHDQAKVPLPPYHPDTPEIRHDWAQYYDKVEDMDAQVGQILETLEKDGLAEDTIVFYYADHGGVLCRSKRFLNDTGTHVPMIIRFPEKYQHLAPGKPGTRTDRIVSFVDLAPTLLSLADIKIPDYIQGEAFLGKQQREPREYAYLFRGRMDERYDMMRAIRDKKFKYIRNYMPHRIYGQHVEYLWKAPATRSWEEEFKAGRCNRTQSIFWGKKPPEELYDTSADPWEVNNLADNPEHRKTLERMRRETMAWVRKIKDPGFMPEGEMIARTEKTTNYDITRQADFPIERIIETAEMATMRNADKLDELIKRLEDPEACIRFWAATGCIVLGKQAKPAEPALVKLLKDSSGDVRIAAAEALCVLDKDDIAIPVIIKELQNENPMIALHAANVLGAIGSKARPFLSELEASAQGKMDNKYQQRALKHAINKLNL
jgi:arylsulfatase A-like enzyme